MAITIKKDMDYLSGLYNKNPFIIDSDNNEEDNFYYLFYIIDTNGNVASLRQPKNVQGYAILDPNNITKNKVSYNFNPTATDSVTNANLFYQYKVAYGTISDGTYDNPTTSNIINGFPIVQQLDYLGSIEDFFLQSSDSKLLTDFTEDMEIIVNKNSYYTFNYIRGNFTGIGTSYPYRFRYTFYKTDGSSDTYTNQITAAYSSVSTSTFVTSPQNIIQTVGVGIQNILGITMDDATTFTLDYFDDVEYYEVKAESSVSVAKSKTYTFRLKCEANHTAYQVFYLNSYGAFDAIEFNHGNVNQISQKTITFQKDDYRISGDDYLYTNGNRGNTTISKVVEKDLTLYSDFVDEPHLPLYEAFQSSPVHILYQDGLQKPLVLTNSSIKLEDKFNREMYQLKYTFEYANKRLINI